MADDNNQEQPNTEQQNQQPSASPVDSAGADPADVDKNKALAVISYIGPLFIVPLLTAKDSKFAMFHANQGLLLFVTGVVFWMAAIVLALIPILGLLIMLGGWVFLLVLFVLGIVNAANGELKELPLIGHFKILS